MLRYTFLLAALGLVLTAATLPEAPAPEPRTSVATAEVATYAADPAHSFVGFRIRHLGIVSVLGSFDEYTATITVDPTDLSTLQAETTIQVASVNTRIQRRDDHLRSADFFEVETYPTMSFTSTSARDLGEGRFELSGDLTIRDVTRPVVLEGEMLGTAVGMQGEERIGFSAQTTIDRHDFGVSWEAAGGAGDPVIGREVTILLEVQGIRQ